MGFAPQEDQVVVGAADGRHFLDFGHFLEFADHGGRRLGQHADEAIGAHRGFFQQAPQAHAVAGHDVFAFQPGDARHHRGAGQPELARQDGGGLARIGLQQAEQLPVDGVESFVHALGGAGRKEGDCRRYRPRPARVNTP
ncbi:hypothetical protein D9M68_749530 [compost metagenome]